MPSGGWTSAEETLPLGSKRHTSHGIKQVVPPLKSTVSHWASCIISSSTEGHLRSRCIGRCRYRSTPMVRQALPNGSWHITGSRSVHPRAHTTFPRKNICTGICSRCSVDLHVISSVRMPHAGEEIDTAPQRQTQDGSRRCTLGWGMLSCTRKRRY